MQIVPECMQNIPECMQNVPDVGSFDIRSSREELSGGGQVTMCGVHRYNSKYRAEGRYSTQGERIGETSHLILTREGGLHDTNSWCTVHCPSFQNI